MTNQEAITIILEEHRSKKCQIVNVNGRLVVGLPDHDSNIEKAIDMAIAAMEKEIPREAIKGINIQRSLIGDEYDWEYTRYCCPKCGSATHITANYCPECGQAIDWSEGQH